MAVPGHDQRDFDFATALDLPIVRVIAGPGDDAKTPLTEAYAGDGVMVNSGRFDGLTVAEGKRAVVEWLADERNAARARVNFRLHDWCVSRQRYWGPPIPIVHCDTCGPVPVPESELPVEHPPLEDFQPDDSGVSPLQRATEWYETPCPRCGHDAHRETDVTDNFLCSGWYFLRYPSAGHDDVALDPELTRKWLPVDSYIGGNEHAVLHLMYARFLTMALHDLGVLDFEEPFDRFRAHGLLISGGRKMSKSKGNVVLPDKIVARFGADTMRLYLLFLGPYEHGGDWQDKGIQGPFGFLNRLWQSARDATDGAPDPDVERALHRTIRQVTEQVPALQYNTAIAAMMEYLNVVRADGRTPRRSELEPLLVLLAPFVPHLAEELYARFGHARSIFDGASWPAWDEGKLADETVEIAVQVNGRLRGPRLHRGRSRRSGRDRGGHGQRERGPASGGQDVAQDHRRAGQARQSGRGMTRARGAVPIVAVSRLPMAVCVLLAVMLAGGCGFQLRTWDLAGLERVRVAGADTPVLARELERALDQVGVTVAEVGGAGVVVVRLSGERESRRTASVTGGARVAEYEMTLVVSFGGRRRRGGGDDPDADAARRAHVSARRGQSRR